MRHSLLLLFISVLFCTKSFAQNGKITGKVIDEKNAETLIGATVQIQGTSNGASADMDGNFEIPNLAAGTYTIECSYLGFDTKIITDVVVKAGEVNSIVISMHKTSKELGAVKITATLKRESTAALLSMQKNSVSVSDGVSADLIKRTPDKNTSDVLKRVSGASIQDNKFAIIRGLNDRYNAAYLNGAPLPSSEPDRKAFAFDIFPANMLDNLIITKTATPELPAEFAGGIISINTKDVPEKNFYSLSFTEGYNTITTGEQQVYSQGGRKDWLGLDDGTRALPYGLPSTERFVKILDQAKFAQRVAPSDWSLHTKTFSPNMGLQYSMGLSYPIGKTTLAMVGAVTYNRTNNYNETVRRDYSGTDSAASQLQYDYVDKTYNTSTLAGVLANFSFKVSANHTFSFKNLWSVNSDNKIIERNGTPTPLELLNPIILRANDRLFTSNKIYSGQLGGEDYLPKAKVRMSWVASYSSIERLIPNERRSIYTRNKTVIDTANPNPIDTIYKANISSSNVGSDYGGGMFWSQNNEKIYSIKASFNRTLNIGEFKNEIKIGGLYQQRSRVFTARRLGYTMYGIPGGTTSFKDSLLYLPEDQIFLPENMGIIKPYIKGGAQGVGGFKLTDGTRPSDGYTAASYLTSAFIMLDNKYKFARLVWGLRSENFVQTLNARKNTDTAQDIHLHTTKLDILPSANLIFAVTKKQNIRLAYSQTVNRPEYRELAPFAFYDFATQFVVSGRDSLRRAKIHNADVRYEIYPGRGQMLSVSGFYKKFIDPIEQISLSYTDHEITYNNLKEATNYGAELEFRVLLAALFKADSIPVLNNLTAFSNLSVIRSSVSTEGFVGTGGSTRPLQGQSPYVFNAGMYYLNDKLGVSVAGSFNRVGARIYVVGNVNDGAIWEAPRSFLDFQVAKLFWKKRIEVKLNCQNVLAQNQNFYQNKYVADAAEVKGVKATANQLLLGDAQNYNGYNKSVDDLIWSTKYGVVYSLGVSVKL